ncbi:MAG TPA: hypothetical protein P5307_29105, partial [Pirellulaceae bacterium]|nr:hypothetical protein [Pirellulaceae bacterium]
QLSIQNLDIVIGPSLTRHDFLASSIGRSARVSVQNEPYCSFNASIPAGGLLPLPTGLTIYFFHDKLKAVSIAASDDRFGTSWDDWSKAKELERKRYHDQWLAATTGTTNGRFLWGHLSSNFDAKSGFSSIHLRYS